MTTKDSHQNPLRTTLQRLHYRLGMARATQCDEAMRIDHIRAATLLTETALWQLDHHPAYAAHQYPGEPCTMKAPSSTPDPFAYVDASDLIQPDKRTPAERWLDAEMERRGANEQGAEANNVLRQIALEAIEKNLGKRSAT